MLTVIRRMYLRAGRQLRFAVRHRYTDRFIEELERRINGWATALKQTNPSAPCYSKGLTLSQTQLTRSHIPTISATDRGPTLKFAAGDTYKIHKVLVR